MAWMALRVTLIGAAVVAGGCDGGSEGEGEGEGEGESSEGEGEAGEGEGKAGEGEGEGEPQPLETTFTVAPASGKNSTDSRYVLACNNAPCTFECALDDAAFTSCPADGAFTGLAVGDHRLQARAIDAAGTVDPTPAEASFSLAFGFRSVAVGGQAVCAISGDYRVACWGEGEHGGVGDGDGSRHVVPAPTFATALPDGLYEEVISFAYGMCAVGVDNVPVCFGYSEGVWVGFDDAIYAEPVPVPALARFEVIKSVYGHACGLEPGGALFCWGDDGDEQLGNGPEGSGPEQFSGTPLRILADRTFVDVALPSYGVCAIDDGGRLWCWGSNNAGSAGAAFPDADVVPTPIQVGNDDDWLDIESGWYHTCGIKLDGSLWCFGDNFDGQAGHPDATTHVPTQVGRDTDWVRLAANASGTCAARASGQTFCFGDASEGQIGDPQFAQPSSATPVPTTLASVPTALASYEDVVCAVVDGDVVCWGAVEPQGALGRGVFTNVEELATIDSGWSHLSVAARGGCGIRSGELHCWGFGFHVGKPGIPLLVTPERVGTSSSWTAISLFIDGAIERGHACGIDAGTLKCWGTNAEGQLGIGNTELRTEPTAIDLPGVTFTVVSVGFNSTCGITTDTRLFCWGGGPGGSVFSPNHGQVGDGTGTQRNSPVEVTTPTSGGFVDVSVHGTRVTVLRDDGSVWGFGLSLSNVTALSPTLIDDENNYASIKTNLNTGSCAVDVSGRFWCTSQLFVPNQWLRPFELVDVATDHVRPLMGSNGVCALTTAGTVRCHVFAKATWNVSDGSFSRAGWPDDVGVADAAGGFHLGCVLTAAGERRCNGRRGRGTLGDGFDERVPTAVLLPAAPTGE